MTYKSPEQESAESEIIKEEWKFWNEVLRTQGWDTGDGDTEREFEFTINRQQEPESFFSADDVTIYKLSMPLEEWTNTIPEFKTMDEERWIQIEVLPKDPYHPRLGVWTNQGNDFYFTENTEIYLSNLGRGYYHTNWCSVLDPDIHPQHNPALSYLKEYPKAGEIHISFDREPEYEEIEPFQPLQGDNLERLDFLKMKLQKGEVTVPTFEAE